MLHQASYLSFHFLKQKTAHVEKALKFNGSGLCTMSAQHGSTTVLKSTGRHLVEFATMTGTLERS